MPDPFDGKPHYCVTCGEPYEPGCQMGCKMESEETAKLRAARRRPQTSDLKAFTPED